MLKELHAGGLNLLELGVEWAVYDKPIFSVVHAAALNGHTAALEWIADTYGDLAWLDRPDAAGCTPLYYAVQTARSMKTARFLLRCGCDPFAWNPESGRSPLSAAIELLPKLAKDFLAAKTQPVDSWWGNPVIRFDFDGIAVSPQCTGQLLFTSESGDRVSIEGLIARSMSPDLASVPIITRLLDRKWEEWARNQYWYLLATFLLLVVPYAAEAIVGPYTSAEVQGTLFAVAVVGYFECAQAEWLQLQSRGINAYVTRNWNIVDIVLLVTLPFTVVPHIFDALDLKFAPLGLEPTLTPVAVALDAALLLVVSLRFLRYLSVFSELRIGPYLYSVLQIVSLSWQPLLFLSVVVASFAAAFVLVFRYGSATPVGYWDMIILLMRWIFQPDEAFEAIKKLPLEAPGFVLFLLYICVAVLGSLRLVQDSVNVSQESTDEGSEARFQALRLEIVDDIEQQMLANSARDRKELSAFYDSLQDGGQLLQLETRAELWPRRKKHREARASPRASVASGVASGAASDAAGDGGGAA